MNKNIKAFTFVELIVVLVIIAILSTIGFTVYESYLSSGRDTNRVVQLKDIHNGLTVYSTKSKLPLPEGEIKVVAGTNTISYQGNLSEKIVKTISYNGGGKDPSLDIYPTYTISANKRNFQLLSFVEDAETLLLQAPVKTTNANVNYTVLFPKVLGSPIGILLDASTQEPIQENQEIELEGDYDILTGTGELRVFYSDTEFIDTSWGDIVDMIPNRTCKRISDFGNAAGNGEYITLPDGITKKKVYCNMEIDGGGWTLVARSVEGATTSGFGWIQEAGDIRDDTQPYSYGSGSRLIDFSQIMLAPYISGKNINFAASYNVDSDYYRDNYNLQSSNPESTSYTSPLNTCTNLIPHPTDTTPTHCSTYDKRYWGKFGYDGYVIASNTSEEFGLRGDGTRFNGSDEYDDKQAMIFIR